MEFSQSLKLNRDFRRVYSRGRSVSDHLLVLYCRKNSLGVNRLGVTVGKKLGGAVKRNLVRRRIREAYRTGEQSFRPGWDIVVVARTRAAEAAYAELSASLLSLSDRLRLLRGGG